MTLARYDTWVRSVPGQAAAGAQVYICTQPATTSSVPPTPLASLFADPLGVTPLTQPLVCDGFGHAYCYAAIGVYTVVVVTGGIVQQVYPDQATSLSSTGITTVVNLINGIYIDSTGSAGSSGQLLTIDTITGNATWETPTPVVTAVDVNSASIVNPNFSNSTPAAPSGKANVTWQVSGSNISAYVPATTTVSAIGSNVIFIENPVANGSGFDAGVTDCIVVRIPAGSVAAVGSKIKVTISFAILGAGFAQLTGVVRLTAPGGTTFTNTVPITFGGSATPTFTGSTLVYTSDDVSVPINGTSDVYIIFNETNVSGGTVLNVFRESYIHTCSGETTGGTNYSTVSAIPNLSTLLAALSTQCCLVSQVVITG